MIGITIFAGVITLLKTPPFPADTTNGIGLGWMAFAKANAGWLNLVYQMTTGLYGLLALLGVVCTMAEENNINTIHDSILFGIHGGQGNIYDGRYLFMKGCANEANEPLVNLTLIPTQMRGFMPSKVLKQGDLLFDMETDPAQEHPIEDHKIKEAMCRKLMAAMDRIEAPNEEFIRLGLSA